MGKGRLYLYSRSRLPLNLTSHQVRHYVTPATEEEYRYALRASPSFCRPWAAAAFSKDAGSASTAPPLPLRSSVKPQSPRLASRIAPPSAAPCRTSSAPDLSRALEPSCAEPLQPDRSPRPAGWMAEDSAVSIYRAPSRQ